MRIRPRRNDAINEEWINDKTRFACDGLKRQRLDRPYVRIDGKLQPATWYDALTAIKQRIDSVDGQHIAALAGDLCDTESMFALKKLMAALGAPHLDCRQDGAEFDATARAGYLFNSEIANIEKADAILLIGTNPRVEATLINARIYKRWRKGGLKIGLIGAAADITYPYTHLGDGPSALSDLGAFGEVLQNAKHPMLILGAGALASADGAAIQYAAREIAEKYNIVRDGWNGFNVLHLAASRVGGLDIGFLPQKGGLATNGIIEACNKGSVEIMFLLGADEIDTTKLGNAFVTYIGHHGDKGANRADVILPSAAYTEKDATYVNTEGRPQQTHRAVEPVGEAQEDWRIVCALAERIGHELPYKTLNALREDMVAEHPTLANIGDITPAIWQAFGRKGPITAAPFENAIRNFYMTDPISRASATMEKCSRPRG